MANVIGNVPSEDISNEGRLTSYWYSWFTQVYIILFSIQQSGTTANRPTKTLWIGRRYYDTTLAKPVYIYQVTPSVVWKDAAGTTV